MKKNYFKLKIKMTMLVVFVLLLGCGVLTYQKADQIRYEYTRQINENNDFVVPIRMNLVEGKNDELIKQVYSAYYNISRVSDDVGFYSMLKDNKGNTLAEDQNFILVKKFLKDGQGEDVRIILLGEDFVSDEENVRIEFQNKSYSSMEIYGTCDETYIYLEKLSWLHYYDGNYSYMPKENNTHKGTMKFEEWAGDIGYSEGGNDNKYYAFINSTWATYGDWELNEKLNKEAKGICEEIYADYAAKVDTMDSQRDKGLFTCYIGGTGYISGEYAVPYVYVFHPVNIAMGELMGIYIMALILGIVIIGIICNMIEKMYKQQYAYEMNRRELTRGIAHELKTPLAITKGYVENWEYLDEDNRHECSQIMIDEIEHMNTMVTDLLELSRLEAKAKDMNLESVDIYALTKSVLKRMNETIENKKLKVVMVPSEGEFLVNADLEMMRTALVNFVSNAVKYAAKEINITLSESGRKVKFIITNDGKLVNVNKADKVWEEFYREENRTDSSGLGLAITKNILILHKATYGCDSQYGTTTFWFEMKKDMEV